MASISDRDLQRVSGASGHDLVRETPGTARCSRCEVVFSCGEHEDTWMTSAGEASTQPPDCTPVVGPNSDYAERVHGVPQAPLHRQALERDALVVLRHLLHNGDPLLRIQLESLGYEDIDFGAGQGVPSIVRNEYMEVLVAQILEWAAAGRLDVVLRPLKEQG